jgi:hypothetical protein
MMSLLSIRTEATYSLNFLVYLHNIFQNQNPSNEDYRFPLFLSKNIAFQEDFSSRFKELWYEVTHKVWEHPMNDIKMFHGEKDLFYRRLFIEDEESHRVYREIYMSFKVWWDSFAGRFSIERSLNEKGEKLYGDLANSLIELGIAPEKELNISLVYDDCLLTDLVEYQYFMVVSARDFFVEYEKVLAKLQQVIY